MPARGVCATASVLLRVCYGLCASATTATRSTLMLTQGGLPVANGKTRGVIRMVPPSLGSHGVRPSLGWLTSREPLSVTYLIYTWCESDRRFDSRLLPALEF